MKLAKVLGQVVSTRKENNVIGLRLLVIGYVDERLQITGRSAACTDAVNAKAGDIVLVSTYSSARMTKYTKNVCTDNTAIAIVDTISSGKKDWYKRM
jgi:ethanolamine utilization protein EutN